MRNRAGLYVAVLLASACTKRMYSGPLRPASELAVLASDDSVISELDGRKTPIEEYGNHTRFEVLPGAHSVGVTLNMSRGNTGYYSLVPYTVCMKAEAGKLYRVKIEVEGSLWRPYIIDDDSEERVSQECDGSRSFGLGPMDRLLYLPLPVASEKQ